MNFWEKNPSKKGLKQKSEHYHQVFCILNSLYTKFQPKMTSLNFWIKLTQKGYFQSKKENNGNHHQILHIRISLILYLNFNNFDILEQISQIRIFPIENRKSEHHY